MSCGVLARSAYVIIIPQWRLDAPAARLLCGDGPEIEIGRAELFHKQKTIPLKSGALSYTVKQAKALQAASKIKGMIRYDCENVEMPALDFEKVSAWIEQVADLQGYHVGRLSYLFCDDEKILAVNREFLQHDYYTDIITFDSTRRDRLAGDMVISLDTVRTNADGIGEEYKRELLRVIIHGVLHLCGINDKGPGEREIMEAHENQALSLLDL